MKTFSYMTLCDVLGLSVVEIIGKEDNSEVGLVTKSKGPFHFFIKHCISKIVSQTKKKVFYVVPSLRLHIQSESTSVPCCWPGCTYTLKVSCHLPQGLLPT